MDSITLSLLVSVLIVIIINGLAVWWLGTMLLPYLHFGGPYVPSSPNRVKLMVEAANIEHGDMIVDIGSGDGRIVIAAAEAGAKKSVGYEIHSGLVKKSQLSAKMKRVSDKTEFRKQSFWKADLSEFTVVFMFQIPFAMKKISEKLKRELPPGARIISNGYDLPGFKEISSDHQIHVYKNI